MISSFFRTNIGKVTIVILTVTAILVVAAQFITIAFLLLASAVISFLLWPVIEWLQRLNVRRTAAIAAVFIVATGMATLTIALTLPIVINDLSMLIDTVRTFPFAEKFALIEREIVKSVPFIKPGDLSARAQSGLSGLLAQALNILSSVASLLTSLTVIPFITFFLLKDGPKMSKGFVELIPNKYFEMGLNILFKIRVQLRQYLRGVMTEALTIGILVFIGLSVLGTPNAVTLAVISCILNLIPYLGPITSACIAILVSLNQSGGTVSILPLVALFGGIRLFDDFVLIPYLYSRSVETHPVAVILYIFIGSQLLGVTGMVLAIPIATVVKVIMRETFWGLENYKLTGTAEVS
jgi:predicted PurR-regulated permease PerM